MPHNFAANLLIMATPPNKSAANASTIADLAALQSAANTQFIDQAAQVINSQISMGLFVAYVTTFENCDINALVTYFQGLGYGVFFPDQFKITGTQGQPTELFGPSWEQFWANGGLPANLTNPVRLAITWQ